MPKKTTIIGAGFSGLSAACALASKGFDVTVLEKNSAAGGRASVFHADGFTFDMGPSWYWMPDVFEWFFAQYGHKPSDFYDLVRLDPAYRVFFGPGDHMDIPGSEEAVCDLFEATEKGAGGQLKKFLADAGYKYKVGMQDLVFQPCNSIIEFADVRMLRAICKMRLFSSVRKEVYAHFRDPRLRLLLEFPVYFLGALPSNTPAMYSMLNYADLVLGTWYPMGGMYKIIEGMQKVAEHLGVHFAFDTAATSIDFAEKQVRGVHSAKQFYPADGIIAAADYHHVEHALLSPQKRNYTEQYWDKKVLAPSCLIFYIGVRGKVNNLLHHNLFFDTSFGDFADAIYGKPRWPEDPLFYVCAPSKTDPGVAPAGDENLFILIPVAPGLQDDQETIAHFYDTIMNRLEMHCSEPIRDRVVYVKSFAPRDFVSRYNAYKGNAYGLANTLKQTAIFKPKMRSRKIDQLVFAGQLTVPGPGMPPAIISGHVAAKELEKILK